MTKNKLTEIERDYLVDLITDDYKYINRSTDGRLSVDQIIKINLGLIIKKKLKNDK